MRFPIPYRRLIPRAHLFVLLAFWYDAFPAAVVGAWAGSYCTVRAAPLFPHRCVCVALCPGVSLGSCCRCWLRVLLMCSQLVQLSCLASGDSSLWRGIWRRPVPSGRAGGDELRFVRAVGCLGASFVLKLT